MGTKIPTLSGHGAVGNGQTGELLPKVILDPQGQFKTLLQNQAVGTNVGRRTFIL